MDSSAKNADRFTGFANTYNQMRPRMPLYPADIITRYLGHKPGLVIDMGCGTGLSTAIWKGRCERVIGIEPSDDMRTVAEKMTDENTSFVKAFAHETNLETACADAVVCSQSFHWMNPEPTLREADRILKKGGVFATVDCDWPPVCSWQAEKAYKAFDGAVTRIEEQNPELKDGYMRWSKSRHLQNIINSGYFRYAREIVFANTEPCDADRFIGLALSQGGLQSILKYKPQLVEAELEEFSKLIRDLFKDRKFEVDFCYRMRIGVK